MLMRGTMLVCRVIAVLVVCLTATDGTADEPARDTKLAGRDEIALLIERLGSTSFTEREVAGQRLVELGATAREQLVQAKNSESAEIRSRVAAILKRIDKPPTIEDFTALAKQANDKLDLELGLWLIARIVDPGVKREELTKPLDALAARVRRKLGEGVTPREADPQQVVAALRAVLFEDDQFTGNVNDYDNPGNSSLVRVLATRKGLPITLSHVVVAVGERLEVPFVGVPTPGRYLVKYEGRRAPPGFPREDIFLNPYLGGTVLSRDDREQQFPGLDPDDFPEPSTNRLVLVRMLNNLETHLFNRDEIDQAYLAVAFRVALEQHDPQ